MAESFSLFEEGFQFDDLFTQQGDPFLDLAYEAPLPLKPTRNDNRRAKEVVSIGKEVASQILGAPEDLLPRVPNNRPRARGARVARASEATRTANSRPSAVASGT